MAYQQETFSIPKISVNGTFRLNFGSLVKNVFSGSLSNFNFKKFLPVAIFVLFVLGTGFLLYKRISSATSSTASNIKVKGAKAVEELNREYAFPLRDEKGEEVGTFKFVVQQ